MASKIPSLVTELESASVDVDAWSQQDPAVRRKICNTLRKLSVDLDTPGDLADRICYQPMEIALIRIGLDLDIFNILARSPYDLEVTRLAKETGVTDQTLLRRVLRALAATSAIGEAGVDIYRATNVTNAMASPKGMSQAKLFFDFIVSAWDQLPTLLAKSNYSDPTDPLNSAIQLAEKAPGTLAFEMLQDRPDILKAFNTLMSFQREGRPNFTDFFPVESQLIDGITIGQDTVLLVDVGGGRGHEIVELRKRFPNLPGRTILQDQPHVIKEVQGTDGLEAMGHDLFKSQPIRGARAYYFRNIFHNWTDKECGKILEQTVSAMTPNYSKLLINEYVIPDQGAGFIMTRSDINMMAMASAKERSEKQWRELLGRFGLEIIHIWSSEQPDSECIIEAQLK